MAERRKNDPVLNHTQDHLVRKLFNKFKKGPDCGPSGGVVGPDKTAPLPLAQSISNNRDIEKGGHGSGSESNPKTSIPKTGAGGAGADGVTPLETISEPVVPKKPSGLKGWGRLKVSAFYFTGC